MRSDNFTGLRAGYHGHYLEGDPRASPLEHPRLQKPQIIALHQLEASTEVWLDPAIDVLKTIRDRASAITHALVDGNHVVVSESLDDHEKHVYSSPRSETPIADK